MTYEILCQLFLLVLLGISCARIFFIQIARQDPLSTVPLLTFILSILNQMAFGLSVFGILITVLALFVTIWNSNALSRFRHKLVVDHYGILFSIFSIINLILVIVLTVFVILLRPGKIDTKKFGVTITSETYAGTIESGFHEYTSPAQRRSFFLKKYTSTDRTYNPFNQSRTIVFVPGELSSVDLYEPFFVKLARDGYTVYAADFYTKDIEWFGNFWDFKPFRRFVMRFCKIKNQEAYAKATSQKSENFTKEVLALIKHIDASRSDRIFVVGDGETQAAYTTICRAEKTVRGTFDLANIPSYTTPGYGPIESTDPFLARYFDHKRDGSFYMSSHIAGILEKYINEIMEPAPEPTKEIQPEISDTEENMTEENSSETAETETEE